MIYSAGLFLGFSTSLWPLPSLRCWTLKQRVQSLCLLFVVVSCVTHLSWELIWLIAHDTIAASRDAAWAYPWWPHRGAFQVTGKVQREDEASAPHNAAS